MGPIFNPTGTYMIYLPLVAAMFALIFDLGKRKFNQRTGYRWFVLEGTLSWGAIEMVRLFIPIAGTWGFIACPLYRQVWFIQPVSIFGIIGQGMLIMSVNYILALGIINWIDKGERFSAPSQISEKLVRHWANGSALALILWTGLSLILMQTNAGQKVTTTAVQPDISPIVTGNLGRDEILAQLYTIMITQTREAAEQGADFIVWPEGAIRYDPQKEDPLGLIDLARELESYLVIGYVVNLDDGTFRNEATVIDPSGQFLGVFGKDHPVLFGGETSPTRGTYPVYQTPIGTLGTIICYDLDYTDTARKLAVQGAQLIGVPSNDWGGIADKH